MHRSFLLLSLLLATPAFAQGGGATIGTQIATNAGHEGMNVTLVAIDGESVDSGSTMWGDDKNLSYPLTPGSHTVTLQVQAGGANERKDAVLYVADGQHYTLGAQTVPDQTTGDPSSYMAWIQDQSGARVWAANYTVSSTVTIGKSPWQH